MNRRIIVSIIVVALMGAGAGLAMLNRDNTNTIAKQSMNTDGILENITNTEESTDANIDQRSVSSEDQTTDTEQQAARTEQSGDEVDTIKNDESTVQNEKPVGEDVPTSPKPEVRPKEGDLPKSETGKEDNTKPVTESKSNTASENVKTKVNTTSQDKEKQKVLTELDIELDKLYAGILEVNKTLDSKIK